MELKDYLDTILLASLFICVVGIFIVSKEILKTVKSVKRKLVKKKKLEDIKLPVYKPTKRKNYNDILYTFSNSFYTNYRNLKNDYESIMNAYLRNEDYILLLEDPEYYKLMLKTVYDLYINKIDKLLSTGLCKTDIIQIIYDVNEINRSGFGNKINNFEKVYNKVELLKRKYF